MTWTIQPRSSFGPLSSIIVGEGRLDQFIHCVGLRLEAWGTQINALSQTCRVIAVELPGHGPCGPLASTSKLHNFTDTIATALNGPAVLIGHSFGAMIALNMAIRHCALAKGVALLNAVCRRDVPTQAAVIARANSRTEIPNRWFGTVVSLKRAICEIWLRSVYSAGRRPKAADASSVSAELTEFIRKCP